MLLRILCCVLSLCCLTASAAEIYKTRDKNGNVIYSDKPTSSTSEQVVLPPINTVPSTQPNPSIGQERVRPPAEEAYEIRIISPRDNAVITAEQRDVAIAINLNRPLADDHWLLYYMDGELLEETKSTSIVIREAPRGGRSLSVEVVAGNGESLAVSESVTVNIMRPIVKPPAASGPRP